MAKKLLFVFAGTGAKAEQVRDFDEGTANSRGEEFNDDVIRIYFNGCQDERVGGKSYLIGLLDPDLDVAAKKIRKAFSKKDGTIKLSLATLKNEFGDAIIVEPDSVLNEAVDDITLYGFSRGAVTTFATARALDDLDVSVSILAEDPVPGDSRADSYKKNSQYALNSDLSACKNIDRGEVLLGTYSKHNWGWENKWFRQMAPKFNASTDSHLYMVPKKQHVEFNRRATTYRSQFLQNRGLIKASRYWNKSADRNYVIPKVEQQKFHFGVVGRTEYLPSFKMDILDAIKNRYDNKNPCPVNKRDKFKYGQALMALQRTTKENTTFETLSKAVLADSDKGKALREFIVELDGIIQYSKETHTLKASHVKQLTALENDLYKLIANFSKLNEPGLEQKELFELAFRTRVKRLNGVIPVKIYNKLSELTNLLLRENPLTRPHLVKFIDENETFSSNLLAADQDVLDGPVKNADELATKLFHSSHRQRVEIFNQERGSLPGFIKNASDLANIAQFLTTKQLNELFDLGTAKANQVIDRNTAIQLTIANRIKTSSDLILVLQVLPTVEHRSIIYHAVKAKIDKMKPTFEDLVRVMEYLSEKDCIELCKVRTVMDIPYEQTMMTSELIKQRLSDSKVNILKVALNVKQSAPELGHDQSKASKPPALTEGFFKPTVPEKQENQIHPETGKIRTLN